MVREQNRMADSHNLACVADVPCLGLDVAREGSEISHRPVFPQEGVRPTGFVPAPANDLTGCANTPGFAVIATQRSQIGNSAAPPHRSVLIVVRKRRCPADNIPCVVDVPSCTQTWF